MEPYLYGLDIVNNLIRNGKIIKQVGAFDVETLYIEPLAVCANRCGKR